ncbi:M23 family metallopeptidase [Thalassobacillus sp. CUG 92003]|uniref:M23 family metallopeptidase n=1 Tax=Thalassobacillus sp. CUG 92003 TaxID=2736641 RepID=UPI0015E77D56|nr:M23 family metallopeptidase [Thalassobacillus sp. CUG 92003]
MKIKLLMLTTLLFLIQIPSPVDAQESDVIENRMALYKKISAVTLIPWYYLAAIDQYERQVHEDEIPEDRFISFTPSEQFWYGTGNILTGPTSYPHVNSLFGGYGDDGNGDGHADITDDEDLLWTLATYIESFGVSEEDIKIALWRYYHRDLTVQTIMNTAKVFQTFQSVELTDRAFPLSTDVNYTYHNTWGDRRGYGGRRIHEGTDIFADYGVSVKSPTYGVIEMKGWNEYGGWRIGIRDTYNIYHYFAHLNGFEDGIKVGDVVKPGDVVGYVGSSGYGPPGTSGKFPPHLHYGMYQDNGTNEWSFDPYPYLKKWEKMAN